MSSTTRVAGVCDPAFKAVREALEQNLAEGKEIGECVAVVVNGKTVVDLWGGYKDRARTQPWERDTLVCMFSVGKPLSILPVLILADRGRIELDRPVSRYWPEFGQAGKEAITVSHVISHLAAIPGALKARKGRCLPLGKDGSGYRGTRAIVGAWNERLLSYGEPGLSDRRVGATRHRQDHRPVLARRNRPAARHRLSFWSVRGGSAALCGNLRSAARTVYGCDPGYAHPPRQMLGSIAVTGPRRGF